MRTPKSRASAATSAASMRRRSQLSKSGVTGSGSHSPRRKLRIHPPLVGERQLTGSGSAVIGRAWRMKRSLPWKAHSISCGVPNAAATRPRQARHGQRLSGRSGRHPPSADSWP